jgi:hypothetical protein
MPPTFRGDDTPGCATRILLDRKQEWPAARTEDYRDIDDICRAARTYRLDGIKKDAHPLGASSSA